MSGRSRNALRPLAPIRPHHQSCRMDGVAGQWERHAQQRPVDHHGAAGHLVHAEQGQRGTLGRIHPLVAQEGGCEHLELLVHHHEVGVHQTGHAGAPGPRFDPGHLLQRGCQLLRQPDVVLVGERRPARHPVPQAGRHQVFEVAHKATSGSGVRHQHQPPAQPATVLLQHRQRSVRRAVVAHQQPEVLVRLGEERFELRAEVLRPVVRRQQHIHRAGRHGRASAPWPGATSGRHWECISAS